MPDPMETLREQKCRTCGGKKGEWFKGDCGGTPPQMFPCDSCHHPDTQEPTGKLVPGLVERCARTTDRRHWDAERQVVIFSCPTGCPCQSTGWVPVAPDTALRVMMEHEDFFWVMKRRDFFSASWKGVCMSGETLLEALASAILASVEVKA